MCSVTAASLSHSSAELVCTFALSDPRSLALDVRSHPHLAQSLLAVLPAPVTADRECHVVVPVCFDARVLARNDLAEQHHVHVAHLAFDLAGVVPPHASRCPVLAHRELLTQL